MSGVLEETTTREIDKAHVVKRVEDWADRVDVLYRRIEDWLPSGWTARRVGTVRMHEELMQRFGVPARDLPVLELSHNGKPSARIEPRGLWIIGANGRLDFFRGSDHYVINDSAENFEQPDWQIAPLSDRRNSQALSREALIAVL
jgi:hypothetical protein